MNRAIAFSVLLACNAAAAAPPVWQPGAGRTQIALWPATPPDAQPAPGAESVTQVVGHDVAGKPWQSVSNVTRPTMTVYAPQGANTGAAVVVFPGGGFQILAIDLEGSEVCDWLVSRGITCVLLKYRVPGIPYDWHCDCRPHNLQVSVPALEDAQRALRLVRHRAAEWHVDPHRIGVIGFSAGGYLVAETSTRFGVRLHAPVDAADGESSRPDFAMAIYPGHLANAHNALNPNVTVSADTPPTFLVQAEDDKVDSVQNALAYHAALERAGVAVEMHLYARGGHAFGLRRSPLPVSGWPRLAEEWLCAIGVLGKTAPACVSGG